MPLRRKIALAVCAATITAPLLTSCGFDDYATDQPYTAASGPNSYEGTVDVLSTVIVAARPGSGTLAGGLANTAPEPSTFTALSGDGLTVDLEPVEIPAEGYVALAEEDIHVTGDFEAGDVLEMTAEIGRDRVDLEVVVVTNCDEFEGFDTSESTSGEEYDCEYAHSEGH
ncbi:hypothetical protein [Nocardioides dongkuii]|nr:hypothetical protein [Nocardioides dongkuii]